MSAVFIFKSLDADKVVVFWYQSEQVYRQITYYLKKRQTADGALSRDQAVLSIQRYLQKPHKYTSLDLQSPEAQQYMQRSQHWIDGSSERTKRAAQTISTFLTPYQNAGIIGPTKCIVL